MSKRGWGLTLCSLVWESVTDHRADKGFLLLVGSWSFCVAGSVLWTAIDASGCVLPPRRTRRFASRRTPQDSSPSTLLARDPSNKTRFRLGLTASVFSRDPLA